MRSAGELNFFIGQVSDRIANRGKAASAEVHNALMHEALVCSPATPAKRRRGLPGSGCLSENACRTRSTADTHVGSTSLVDVS